MGSSKVTLTFVSTATAVAPDAGVRELMLGGAVSAPEEYPRVTELIVGVTSGAVVVKAARYCTYREFPPTAPPLATDAKALQVPSGVGVFPRRTDRPRVVPPGTSAAYDSVPQLAGAPASRTRDVKVPGDE